ncbi:LolA family protein [Lapillicoccus jejuensis]|uniref:Outer membrane lipoprotein-sorting protein n=1 Tax=Lapillicoccus jejuensis TaxID=402171 RepID=A0A542E5C4_9MICO|nr:DUF2092 domain-containing protein [Lapillicoccus jejuensis]TQJ10538.1 outer membrane lipoprotein-sorting protein [Lapillicoccus jejuensis]
MSTTLHRPAVRWSAPVAAVAVIAGGALWVGRPASADGGLPTLTAQQLLVAAQRSAAAGSVTGLSGTVRQRVDLGLPDLGSLAGSGAGGSSASGGLSPMTLLSGTRTWRVWVDGPTRQRVALVSQLGESDVVRDGRTVWTWDSAEKTATKVELPAPTGKPGAAANRTPTDLVPRTPQEAADQALAAAGRTTDVTTSGLATVAGRDAYELVLTPKDAATRVGQVRIALDGATKVPLRVEVFARGASTPAVDVGFTSVDLSTPAASTFAFTPPPGATVRTESVPQPSAPDAADRAKGEAAAQALAPHVVGDGWSSVLVASVGAATKAAGSGATSDPSGAQDPSAALGVLPKVSGSWGSGRLLDGALFSAVLTDDGRVAVGAVAPDRLYAALSAH